MTKRVLLNEHPILWGTDHAMRVLHESFAAQKPVLAESDTVWGLLAPATKDGVLSLDIIKKRRDKPYIILLESVEAVERSVVLQNDAVKKLVYSCWPGPVTLLLKAAEGSLAVVKSPTGVIGVRVPDHEPLRMATVLYGGLLSTSANVTGKEVPVTVEAVDSQILQTVGAIIYNPAGYQVPQQPSTILDCTGLFIRVVRRGAYPVEELERIAGASCMR